jgi:hypothetical protein
VSRGTAGRFPFVLTPRTTISFNKRREDFVDLKSYNDYLEEVEEISKIFQPTIDCFFLP